MVLIVLICKSRAALGPCASGGLTTYGLYSQKVCLVSQLGSTVYSCMDTV